MNGDVFLAVFLFIAAAMLIVMGISFIADIKRGNGPVLEGATVESPGNPAALRRRTYTFLRVESETVAWIITVVTFLLAAGAAIGGIVVLAS
ncbi:hypothetical protein ACH3VR_10895 [Microbacterium sp. B2969]|uniref:Uncharacterized protein n=1 Tax=Microbacterium alkaliflavum TaxID=3248839 RepID=A0ABW7Q8S4_9MICO